MAAALSFYTLFSAAPLVIIVVALTGIFFGREVARDELLQTLQYFGGQETREYILGLVERWQDTTSGVLATIAGFAALLYGAYRVFGALRDALNVIFNVRPKEDLSWKRRIANEAFSFVMILVIGLLLLVSLVVSAVITALSELFDPAIIGSIDVWHLVNLAASFALITVLFALMIRILPDVRIRWRDIFVGAALTSLMFNLGKLLISLYLAKSGTTSIFGAAGSLVVFLFWMYYSAQIFFLGAELTQAYTLSHGGGIEPKRGARLIDPGPPKDPRRDT